MAKRGKSKKKAKAGGSILVLARRIVLVGFAVFVTSIDDATLLNVTSALPLLLTSAPSSSTPLAVASLVKVSPGWPSTYSVKAHE